MTLGELLHLRGLDARNHRVKVVRHEDRRVDVHKFSREELEIYQSHQNHPVFDHVDYVISCIGAERGLAVLIGVYRVKTNPALKRMPNTRYYYKLHRDARFRDLEG